MKTCVVLALFLMAGVSLADIQKRIIGGRRCTPQEEQHYVFLETDIEKLDGPHKYICSGSVIGDGLWVLTAAHCDYGGPSFTVESADGTVTQTVLRAQSSQHRTADVMLLKLSQHMTPIPLATDAECTALRNLVKPSNPVTFHITARDTPARADYLNNGIGVSPDETMCANINVDRLEPFNDVVEHTGTNQVITNECCRGLPGPGGCQTCGGDSGAGYIYNNKLYAVHKGRDDQTLRTGIYLNPVEGFTVCDTDIRQWIDQTMAAP